MKTCKVCGKSFEPNCNHQIYCSTCAAEVRKLYRRQYYKDKRDKALAYQKEYYRRKKNESQHPAESD